MEEYLSHIEKKVQQTVNSQIVTLYANLSPQKTRKNSYEISVNDNKNSTNFFKLSKNTIGLTQQLSQNIGRTSKLQTPSSRNARKSIYASQPQLKKMSVADIASQANNVKEFKKKTVGFNNFQKQVQELEEQSNMMPHSTQSKSTANYQTAMVSPSGTFYNSSMLNSKEQQYFRSWKNWKGAKIDTSEIKNLYNRTAKTSIHEDQQNTNQKFYSSTQTNFLHKKSYQKYHKKDHKRYREFNKLDLTQKVFLDGMPQGTYDSHILRDRHMQNNLLTNLLNVLLEKMQNIKYIVMEYDKARKIFMTLTEQRRGEFNEKWEQTVIALEYISYQILKDLREDLDAIGIQPSPLWQYRSLEPDEGEDDFESKKNINGMNKSSLDQIQMEEQLPEHNQQIKEEQPPVFINHSNNNLDGQPLSRKEKMLKLQARAKEGKPLTSSKNLDNSVSQNQLGFQKSETIELSNKEIQQSVQVNTVRTQEQQKSKNQDVKNKFFIKHMQQWETDRLSAHEPLKPRQYLKLVSNSEDEEIAIFDDNMYLFEKTVDFFKDCMEVFRILCRQSTTTTVLNEVECQRVLNIIMQSRMNLGFLYEELKILDKKMMERQRFQKILDMGLTNQSSTNQSKKIQEKELELELKKPHQKDDEEYKKKIAIKNKKLKSERLNQLIQQKFVPKNQGQSSSDSQYQVQQRLDRDTQLLRESYQKDFKIRDVADNRKKLRLQNMQSYFGSVEIQNALRYAKQLPNIKIPLEIIKNC